MKPLHAYTQDAMTQLFTENGAFFAYSDEQFAEQKKDGVEYRSLGAGLIAPKDSVQAVVDGISNITQKGIAQDLAENGKQGVIKRELSNYECIYTGDISECVHSLRDYGIVEDEIRVVYRQMLANGEVEL